MSESHPAPGPERRQPSDGPSIYVASLSDYNAGCLFGVWLSADDTVEGLEDGIASMLATSPTDRRAEEWAIHDYEGFGGLELGEYEPLDRISQLGLGITAHGPAFASWAKQSADSISIEDFEASYVGEYQSLTDYAEDVLDDLGLSQLLDVIPEGLRPYVRIDAEAFGRDLELSGDIYTDQAPGGRSFIFTALG